jgi:uncharacterized cofD-like protein
MKKIVTVGGGSGQYALLCGLSRIDDLDISAVVSMSDSGGSSGRLRSEKGVLPPGDVLKCLIALSPNREFASRFLQRRFERDNKLKGHNAGNLLISTLEMYTDSFPEAVQELSGLLEIRGRVLPVTTTQATLNARLEDGTYIHGEEAIDLCRGDRAKISEVFLSPHHASSLEVYPPVIEAIREADYIIIGPGDLYSSIMPNLKVDDVAGKIASSKAKLIYMANLFTKFGETDGYSLDDFVATLEKEIGRYLNWVVVNNCLPSEQVMRGYLVQKAALIKPILQNSSNERKLIAEDILDESGGVVRHSEEKLAKLLTGLLQ